MTKSNIRKTIQTEMTRLGAERYRITASDEVHFYGTMPQTNQVGWWFAHNNAADYAAQIQKDIKLSDDYVGNGQFK